MAGQVGLPGATVTPCEEEQPSVLTDADGMWTLDLPDLDWVVVDQRLDTYVPNRCVFDPTIEGTVERPFRIGMSGFDLDSFPMASLGLMPKEGYTWVDVDALDIETGDDLLGTTIEISAQYEAAIGQEADGTFIFSNQTAPGYDVIFANVRPEPFTITAHHPDRSECLVPPVTQGEGDDQLNISVYCR